MIANASDFARGSFASRSALPSQITPPPNQMFAVTERSEAKPIVNRFPPGVR